MKYCSHLFSSIILKYLLYTVISHCFEKFYESKDEKWWSLFVLLFPDNRKDSGTTMRSQITSCLFIGFLTPQALFLQMLPIEYLLVLLSWMIKERYSLLLQQFLLLILLTFTLIPSSVYIAFYHYHFLFWHIFNIQVELYIYFTVLNSQNPFWFLDTRGPGKEWKT